MVEYNLDYYENLLRIQCKTAEEISTIRWNWISDIKPKTILDYGSGVGWFRAYQPKGVEVDSFDIGSYPQTGIKMKIYDVVCLWDVLEHIPDFRKLDIVLRISNAVAGTIPMKPDHIEWQNWKHWKPGEHHHFFNRDTLSALFESQEFKLIKSGYPECPPREDVLSFLYRREKM